MEKGREHWLLQKFISYNLLLRNEEIMFREQGVFKKQEKAIFTISQSAKPMPIGYNIK
jgi:hypothetical protein